MSKVGDPSYLGSQGAAALRLLCRSAGKCGAFQPRWWPGCSPPVLRACCSSSMTLPVQSVRCRRAQAATRWQHCCHCCRRRLVLPRPLLQGYYRRPAAGGACCRLQSAAARPGQAGGRCRYPAVYMQQHVRAAAAAATLYYGHGLIDSQPPSSLATACGSVLSFNPPQQDTASAPSTLNSVSSQTLRPAACLTVC